MLCHTVSDRAKRFYVSNGFIEPTIDVTTLMLNLIGTLRVRMPGENSPPHGQVTAERRSQNVGVAAWPEARFGEGLNGAGIMLNPRFESAALRAGCIEVNII